MTREPHGMDASFRVPPAGLNASIYDEGFDVWAGVVIDGNDTIAVAIYRSTTPEEGEPWHSVPLEDIERLVMGNPGFRRRYPDVGRVVRIPESEGELVALLGTLERPPRR